MRISQIYYQFKTIIYKNIQLHNEKICLSNYYVGFKSLIITTAHTQTIMLGPLYGGERGIRTLDTSFEIYTISNRALSTTQTPLQQIKVKPFVITRHPHE